jgi:2-polyprenyl-3-methyl-5-hydroxy-6-metoxy-1,4-benzoquinol methylase
MRRPVSRRPPVRPETCGDAAADGRDNECVGDAIFEDPRLVQLYDAIEGDRKDLDVYASIVAELGALSVLDIGCGTGTFACLLASRGYRCSRR